MRLSVLIVCLVTAMPAIGAGQTAFDPDRIGQQILAYRPIQREGVTAAKFEMATNILAEARKSSGGDSARLNAADYWNVAAAFVMLNEPSEAVRVTFQKAASEDPKTICEYIAAMGAGGLERKIPETVLPFEVECSRRVDGAGAFDLNGYAVSRHLDPEIVRTVAAIEEGDQRHRTGAPVDWSAQRPIDLRNQALVRGLYRKHGRYVGRDLVGPRFETTMWAVVQHSDRAMMEEYLPIIQQAVTDRQIEATPLKMLIDRIQTIRTGAQIFGSQVGVPLADEQLRAAVKSQYHLN